jgi:hypothetical protein
MIKDFFVDMELTVRQRLHTLIQKTYSFCRGVHNRTHIIIDLANNLLTHDRQLKEFFEECLRGTSDPRFSVIFDDIEWHEWPDLDIVTSDDNDKVIKEIKILSDDLNSIMDLAYKYSDFFS